MAVKGVSRIPPELAAAGFEARMRDIPQTVFASIRGQEKEGKTWFCVDQVPGDLAYFDIDKRGARTVAKAQKLHPKNVWPIYLSIPTGEEQQKLAVVEFQKFMAAWEVVLSSPAIKTVVVDTWSEIWELGRIAEFGKAFNVKPHHYGPLNALFNQLLDRVQLSDKNVLLVQKLKEVWENEQPTGKFRAQGFSNTAFKVQVTAEVFFDRKEEEYVIKTLSNGDDIAASGEEFRGPRCNFPELAVHLYPGTDIEQWGG